MSFKEIVGQEIPLAILKNSLRLNRVSHAYLFVGEDGIGKRLVARNLAKVLNCEKNEKDACDQCSSCQKIDRGIHPDVRWFEPDGASQTIKIEHIQELQHEIYLKPFEGKRKVFILLEAERMNREAANAFLKTLEEPPGGSILILITSFPNRLLPTTRSRCQLIRFSLIPQKTIEKFLRENLDCSLAEAGSLSSISEGRLGEAVRFKKEGSFRKGDKILDLILDKKKKDILGIVENIIKIWDEYKKDLEWQYGEDLKVEVENLDKKTQKVLEEKMKAHLGKEYRKAIDEGIEAITLFFRDCLLWKITEENRLITHQVRLDSIRAIAQLLSRQDLEKRILGLKEIKNAISRNANLRLALTVMLLNLGDMTYKKESV